MSTSIGWSDFESGNAVLIETEQGDDWDGAFDEIMELKASVTDR